MPLFQMKTILKMNFNFNFIRIASARLGRQRAKSRRDVI